MTEKPHLLITNDDGIHAPGLRHLWNALNPHFRVTIVAPATEQSCVGLSTSIRTPLYVHSVDWPHDIPAFTVSGTPVDCIKIARSCILKQRPDLIVAGINRGSNAGRNVLYSGTVAGVIEGLMLDIPGVAFSTTDYEAPDFAATEKWIAPIASYVLNHPLPQGTLLNVNFPKKDAGDCQGVKLTRQGKQFFTENPTEHQHPSEGHKYYWLGVRAAEFDEHEESDIYWLERGYVTAVPIHIQDLTDRAHLSQHKEHFETTVTNQKTS